MPKKEPEHYGSGGYCICLHCGTRVPHISGVPCMETKCPNCGRRMVREGSEHHLKFLEAQKRKQQQQQQEQQKQDKPKIVEPKIEEKSTKSKEIPGDWKLAEKQETKPKEQKKIKIAFPTNDGVKISPHVGRAEGFLIYEIQGITIVSQQYYTNPDKDHHHHSEEEEEHHHFGGGFGYGRGMGYGRGIGHGRGMRHGHGSHKGILQKIGDCDIIIVRGIGRRLYADLTALGIKILVSPYSEIKKSLEAYINGELSFDERYIH